MGGDWGATPSMGGDCELSLQAWVETEVPPQAWVETELSLQEWVETVNYLSKHERRISEVLPQAWVETQWTATPSIGGDSVNCDPKHWWRLWSNYMYLYTLKPDWLNLDKLFSSHVLLWSQFIMYCPPLHFVLWDSSPISLKTNRQLSGVGSFKNNFLTCDSGMDWWQSTCSRNTMYF